MKNSFEDTDWNVLKEGNNFLALTETVAAYIKFCQGVCIPSKSVMQYQNSSPWCNKTIKAKD